MHKHISFKFQYCCKIKSNFLNKEPTAENYHAQFHMSHLQKHGPSFLLQAQSPQQQQEGCSSISRANNTLDVPNISSYLWIILGQCQFHGFKGGLFFLWRLPQQAASVLIQGVLQH